MSYMLKRMQAVCNHNTEAAESGPWMAWRTYLSDGYRGLRLPPPSGYDLLRRPASIHGASRHLFPGSP